MDWTTIIREIGGGLPAVVIAGLGFAYWNERKRSDRLVERLINQAQTNIVDAAKRESETIASLEKIVAILNARGGA